MTVRPSRLAAVKRFDTWMKIANPSFQPDLYSLFGWTSAQLFVQALKAAGPDPTRAKILEALKHQGAFTGAGLLAPDNPAKKVSSTCWILLQIENRKYNKVYPSGSGFACSPGGHSTPPRS